LTDRLTEVLRDGSRALLTQAVEAEVSEFLAATVDLKTDDGCRRVVRHRHLPERQIMTGIGPVAVRQPRVRDREPRADDPAPIRFTPAILPPYARRSKSLDILIPILYLKGVSTGDFAAALAALLGKDALGLSATTIARLKEVWIDEHKRWSERELSGQSYAYVWADGVYLQARLEDEAQFILVIIGTTPEGKKESRRLDRTGPTSSSRPRPNVRQDQEFQRLRGDSLTAAKVRHEIRYLVVGQRRMTPAAELKIAALGQRLVQLRVFAKSAKYPSESSYEGRSGTLSVHYLSPFSALPLGSFLAVQRGIDGAIVD
jgi:hypothetical protein